MQNKIDFGKFKGEKKFTKFEWCLPHDFFFHQIRMLFILSYE